MKSEHIETQEEKFQRIINREKPAYYKFLGIDILDVKHGYAKLKMDYNTRLVNPYGYVNGGFLSILADAALACALLGMTDDSPTRRLVTIEYKMNFIKHVKDGSIIAEAKVVHLGKEIALGEVDVRDQQDRMVAKGLITYSVKY
jgi:uncharacterized protein (TIGR00369 family)